MKIIVMQAVSGGGKSTWIRNNYPKAQKFTRSVAPSSFSKSASYIVSADHFFEDDEGNYNFDPAKLSRAHGNCFQHFIECVVPHAGMEKGYHAKTVIVDNTNTSIAELAPYCAAALAYGHELEIVTLLCDPDVAHARNTHGIPLAAVMGQYIRLQKTLEELLPWWPQKIVDTNA